jgi:hypothetical protein
MSENILRMLDPVTPRIDKHEAAPAQHIRATIILHPDFLATMPHTSPEAGMSRVAMEGRSYKVSLVSSLANAGLGIGWSKGAKTCS